MCESAPFFRRDFGPHIRNYRRFISLFFEKYEFSIDLEAISASKLNDGTCRCENRRPNDSIYI